VGSRQRACGKSECQRSRQRKAYAAWLLENPDYFLRRRLRQRAEAARAVDEAVEDPRKREAAAEDVRRPEPLWVPGVLRQIPWDLAQDEIGIPATDYLALTARLLVGALKNEKTQKSVP
jgi:hypothetical protein